MTSNGNREIRLHAAAAYVAAAVVTFMFVSRQLVPVRYPAAPTWLDSGHLSSIWIVLLLAVSGASISRGSRTLGYYGGWAGVGLLVVQKLIVFPLVYPWVWSDPVRYLLDPRLLCAAWLTILLIRNRARLAQGAPSRAGLLFLVIIVLAQIVDIVDLLVCGRAFRGLMWTIGLLLMILATVALMSAWGRGRSQLEAKFDAKRTLERRWQRWSWVPLLGGLLICLGHYAGDSLQKARRGFQWRREAHRIEATLSKCPEGQVHDLANPQFRDGCFPVVGGKVPLREMP